MNTMDVRTQRFIDTLDPKARQAFYDFALAAKAKAAEHGCEYIGIGGNRTYAEQDKLYAKGRTAQGPKVTNAKGGQSNHNFGIAMDFGVFKGGRYLDEDNPRLARQVHLACAALAEEYGLDAGAYWRGFEDPPHYEIHTGMTLAQKRSRFEKEGSVLV